MLRLPGEPFHLTTDYVFEGDMDLWARKNITASEKSKCLYLAYSCAEARIEVSALSVLYARHHFLFSF
jgi:hypothetical protein